MGAVLQALALWLLPWSFLAITIIVFVIVVSVSYGFELFSKITGMGVHDLMDAVFTIAGGAVGMAFTVAAGRLIG